MSGYVQPTVMAMRWKDELVVVVFFLGNGSRHRKEEQEYNVLFSEPTRIFTNDNESVHSKEDKESQPSFLAEDTSVFHT